MILKPLSITDMEQVRIWRNEVPETLRTPYMLTYEQQEKYYQEVICDRGGTTRYWGFWDDIKEPFESFVGYGGIENIQWENRIGEISVLINPLYRGAGLGREAVKLIFCQAFKILNLNAIWGECYLSSPAVKFWEKLIAEYRAFSVELPHRKYWNGVYWPSLYFTFYQENHK